MTPSLRASAVRKASTIRSWLSPTAWWKWEPTPGRPGARPATAIGVGDLPEQQLGADGDDLDPHGASACPRRPAGASRRRPSSRYCAPVNTVRMRPPTCRRPADLVVGQRRGQAHADGDVLDQGLELGRVAGRDGDAVPSGHRPVDAHGRPRGRRSPPPGATQTIPLATRATRAPSTTTLSASGSRKAPTGSCPACGPASRRCRRTWPAGRRTRTVSQLAPHSMIMTMTTGVARSRTTVMALAGVSRADGPKVVPRRGRRRRSSGAAVAHRRARPERGQRPVPVDRPAPRRQVGAVGAGDHDLDERSDRQVGGDGDDPVDLGGLAVACGPRPGASTRTCDRRPDERVPAWRR